MGYTIKFHRLKQERTQREVCEGIISESYLSKIENGFTVPSEEVVRLLFQRLGINTQTIDDGEQIISISNSWFLSLFHRNLEEADTIYVNNIKEINVLSDSKWFNLIELHKLKYYLVKQDKTELDEQYTSLQELSKHFNDSEMYYWKKFSGYYSLERSSYNMALQYFQDAEGLQSNAVYLQEEDKHDLYYLIALSGSYARKVYTTLFYVQKALDYYQRNYQLKNAAKCHILQGIIFTRIKEHEEALKSYRISREIGEKISDKDTLAISIQNIGNLSTVLNKPEQAIKNYLESYHLQKNNDPHKRIIPILSLIKEYLDKKDLPNARKWLETGQRVLNQQKINSEYSYKLLIYEQLINGVDEDLEHLIVKEVIPYFKEKELYFQKYEILIMLADYYYDKRKYKLSADYYKQSINIKKEI